MRYSITAARGFAGESETPPLRLSLWEIRCTNPSVRRLRLDYHQRPDLWYSRRLHVVRVVHRLSSRQPDFLFLLADPTRMHQPPLTSRNKLREIV
jgi:hypothetical protein